MKLPTKLVESNRTQFNVCCENSEKNIISETLPVASNDQEKLPHNTAKPSVLFNRISSLSDSDGDVNYEPNVDSDPESSSLISTSESTVSDSELNSESSYGDQATEIRTDNLREEDDWRDISDNVPNISEYADECTINVPDSAKTPLDYYKLFVTDNIIEKMVLETNNNAQKYIHEKKH